MTSDILIVDDEPDIRDLVSGLLEDEGYQTRTAKDSSAALSEVKARRPSLVILDIWLEGSKLDGLELLRELKSKHQGLPIVMISGHGNIETAVAAIKIGTYDFIEKPFKSDRLLLIVARAIENARLQQENRELRMRSLTENDLVGTSSAIGAVCQSVDKVAPTGSRVMVLGPPGSGKEVVARMLHQRSARADGPFVVVNAASIAPDRMESELFGVEGQDMVGVFEQAHGGTLFLDEVADMPLETQGKILRVLVDQTFVRVGGDKNVKVDVRLISASNRDLLSAVENRTFREDLYYRLNVVPITLPPLSERREDIPLLISYFMKRMAETSGLPPQRIGNDAMAILQGHDWPGNVRQLRNIVERLLILNQGTEDGIISADQLPPEVKSEAVQSSAAIFSGELLSLPLRDAREIFERDYLLSQVKRFDGNISKTAEFVGMERSALHRKLKILGVTSVERNMSAAESAGS